MIGSASKRPSLAHVRRIKRVLMAALALPEDALVTVTQLACLEEDCAPLETVIGWLPSSGPQRQHKVHKPTEDVDASDLAEVCEAWGKPVQRSTLDILFKEA